MSCDCGSNIVAMPNPSISVMNADGSVNQAWYRWFLNVFNRTGAGGTETEFTISDQITQAQTTADHAQTTANSAQQSANTANAAVATEKAARIAADDQLLPLDGSRPMTGPLRRGFYTVASLPAGSTGWQAFVSDALAPVFGTAVTGGGTVPVPVYHDGVSWKVG